MRNWNNEVRERLAGIDLPPDIKEGVVAELAAHLEDCENQESPDRADTLELSERRWRELARLISRAKGDAMNRRKSLWIPMFVNLLLTSAVINVCDRLGMLDLRLYRPDPIPWAPQPWLIVLPVCGATAAFLARRGAGSLRARLIAAVAPSVVWLAVPFVLELIFLCFPQTFVGIPLRSLALSSVGVFVFFALGLLLGAAPFLRTPTAKPQCE